MNFKATQCFDPYFQNGLPGPHNPYIFNGDFVDRGDYSVEVRSLGLSCLFVILVSWAICVNTVASRSALLFHSSQERPYWRLIVHIQRNFIKHNLF